MTKRFIYEQIGFDGCSPQSLIYSVKAPTFQMSLVILTTLMTMAVYSSQPLGQSLVKHLILSALS
jgi:hypothetical protein